MARMIAYNASLTAGTKILSSTTGFVVPKGYAGVTRIYKSGANGEMLKFTFPGGEHRYAQEEVYVGGEIAVETRLLPVKPVWCGWILPEGTKIDVTCEGAESTTEGWIFVEFGKAEDFIYPPLHHEHVDITTGTTADNARLLDIPDGCHTLYAVLCHGANQEKLGFRLTKKGDEYAVIASHHATHAMLNQWDFQIINEQVQSDGIFLADEAAGYGAGAAGDFYFVFLYS